jgi:DNA-binding response OmpR family regulator
MKALIIEDDPDILDCLVDHLPTQGIVVDGAATGAQGLSFAKINAYDVVILDLNLPDMRGETLIEVIHKQSQIPPILVLTVVSDIESKVRLLNSGADDYLCKPFSMAELMARVRALLRRSVDLSPAQISIGGLDIDFNGQRVLKGKREIKLTKKEFALFEYILRNQGTLVSKEILIEHLWDARASLFLSSLETHMANLRKKLGVPGLIHTVHGQGYIVR